MGWGLMLMMVMVDRRPIVGDDGRGGGADIRSRGRSRR